MSSSNSLQIGASALNAFSWGTAVTAHNVANVSTAGFEPRRAVYSSNPNNQGVSFDAVLKDTGSAAVQNPDWAAAKAVYDVTSGLPLEASEHGVLHDSDKSLVEASFPGGMGCREVEEDLLL